MVKALDSRIVVRKFEIQVLLKKDVFGIKWPEKVDMQLNSKQFSSAITVTLIVPVIFICIFMYVW